MSDLGLHDTATAAVLEALSDLRALVERLAEGSPPVGAYDVRTFAETFRLGRTLTYELIASGELPSIKLHGRRVIPAAAAEAWLRARLADEAREVGEVAG